MSMKLRNRTIELSEGEMFIVPKGVEHKPMATKECHIMIIEPKGVINTGNKMNSELKSDNDVWI